MAYLSSSAWEEVMLADVSNRRSWVLGLSDTYVCVCKDQVVFDSLLMVFFFSLHKLSLIFKVHAYRKVTHGVDFGFLFDACQYYSCGDRKRWIKFLNSMSVSLKTYQGRFLECGCLCILNSCYLVYLSNSVC